MTQEEKQLLLQDLSARLPYGVQYKDAHGYKKTIDIWSPEFHTALNTILYDRKPSLYLRPMSSMTEDERMEFTKLFDKWHDDELFDYIEEGVEFSIWKHKGISAVVFDWLNKKMFDYRGLIPMGLALEAQEGIYN